VQCGNSARFQRRDKPNKPTLTSFTFYSRLLAGLVCHTSNHTSRKEGAPSGSPEMAVGDVPQGTSTASHLVWDRVVPDIPDFCRELVAALSEE
jgi:hypothetical protein